MSKSALILVPDKQISSEVKRPEKAGIKSPGTTDMRTIQHMVKLSDSLSAAEVCIAEE